MMLQQSNMPKLIKILGLVLILALCVGFFSYFREAKDEQVSLVGFWNENFPVTSDTPGYYFLEDGRYLYTMVWLIETGEYLGSSGKWKIAYGDLYIIKEREYALKGEVVSCKTLPFSEIKIGHYDIQKEKYAGSLATTLTLSNDKGIASHKYVYNGNDFSEWEKKDMDYRLNLTCN